MGKIFTAECLNCNRIYNFDIGIGSLYDKDTLMNIDGAFNLLTLFKEKNRKTELEEILKNKTYYLEDGYGYKMMICDTCKNFNSRFCFSLVNNDNIFETKFRCHTCRKKLRVLDEEELLKEVFECPKCKKEIKFHISGEWN